MNETYIQTIRGGIQRVFHLSKDHWTQEPKRCCFNYHHELYGYIPVSKISKLIRDDWNETYMNWTEALYKTVKMKYGTESHHTVAKVFIDVDGTEYRTI